MQHIGQKTYRRHCYCCLASVIWCYFVISFNISIQYFCIIRVLCIFKL